MWTRLEEKYCQCCGFSSSFTSPSSSLSLSSTSSYSSLSSTPSSLLLSSPPPCPSRHRCPSPPHYCCCHCWMSSVCKCGWLDMENTILVSGEIQRFSSKTCKCVWLGLTNTTAPNQEIQISAVTNSIPSKANQSKLCEGLFHMPYVTLEV